MRSLSLRELDAEARRRLDGAVYDFFAGGADDEITLRENEAAFARIGLVPRVLRGAGAPNLRTDLIGSPASMPILIAPTAFHRLAHEDGERATARAAAQAEAIYIVSMASTVAIEDIAAAGRDVAEPKLWFQLYIQPDLAFTEAIVRRAEAAGCRAIVVSVDSPVFGRRERDLRNGFGDLPPGMCCENLRDPGNADVVRAITFSPGLNWEHIDWLRKITDLPVVLKGVLHPEDAQLAARRGVDAIFVSNHGGRQLDTVPATVDLLPPVVDAVGDRIPIIMDGGIRRGTDVLKAMALGAKAVAVGRPILWGLSTNGREGVAQVLEMLRSEFERALMLTGCGLLGDLQPDLLRFPLQEKSR